MVTEVSKHIAESFKKLKKYCEKQEFKGYDPFDGLNSKVFRSLPFVKNNFYFKIAWIQLFKRSPINLRKVFLVEKGYNPKGLGLFLSSYCLLYKSAAEAEKEQFLEVIEELTDHLISLKQANYSGSCWGYNFDWQARAFFQPKGTPSIVVTSYVVNALLDAYQITQNEETLEIAINSKDFIINDLNRTYDEKDNFIFSYSPADSSQIFNASLLAAGLLSRIYSYTKEESLIQLARKTLAFCCERQRQDGSWTYGMAPFHQWVDNFHTGYNIECIYNYQRFSKDTAFESNLDKGIEYYLTTFFKPDGTPWYYNNKKYPIDVHNTAQLIITLFRTNRLPENEEMAKKVMEWTIDKMQSTKGYFYYQKNSLYLNKISYIRWSQAWMFYGLAAYIAFKKSQK